MKCSNCDKELTEDITGSNILMRTYKCVCLRLESFYEIEGPEWLLRLASNVCYRLDNEHATKFKTKFKELIKSIKDGEELRFTFINKFKKLGFETLLDLVSGEFSDVLTELRCSVIPIQADGLNVMSNLGQSLINYVHMVNSDEPCRIMHDAWGVEYGSYGNKKSYEQSAIKYADLIIEVMENANDSIS